MLPFLLVSPIQGRPTFSPKLKELKWKGNQPWKAEFRSTIKPFVLGMDAEILLDKRRVNEAKRLKYGINGIVNEVAEHLSLHKQKMEADH